MPLNIDIQQILLHMLNFVILFAIGYFLLYNPIKKFMDKREKYYSDMDEEAEKKLSDSEKLRADYEEKLKELNGETERIKSDALTEARAKADEMIKDAKAEASDIISSARAQGEAEKNDIIRSASDEIRELARSTAEKLITSENEDEYNKFLKSVEEADNGENE